MRASRRGLGGLRYHVLGSCVPNTAVPWCLHQSVGLQLVDTEGGQRCWEEAVEERYQMTDCGKGSQNS